jgi:hypothetical protein
MKVILIVLILAQIYGAFSINLPLGEQRGLMDIWDFISPIAIPFAQGIDTAIATVSNAHSAVTGAVTDAIGSLTSWIGGKLPPLGKRDLEVDIRVNLLNELQSFKVGFQQAILEILQNLLNGKITTQFRPLLSKLNVFLRQHINEINRLITILIPTMQDLTGTHAITSCLHAVKVIEEVIQKIHTLFSS